MKYNLSIFLLLLAITSCAKDKISALKTGDIKIYQTTTGNNIPVKNSHFKTNAFVSEFGPYSSIKKEEVEASGGLITLLYYGNNFFYIPEEPNSTKGFRISTSGFYVLINDSLKLKVGEKVENFLSLVNENRIRRNVKVGNSRFQTEYISIITLPYVAIKENKTIETDVSFSVIFHPKTKLILELSESARH